jgi:hypothetical protein
MPKINPVQAAALSEPTTKSESTKAVVVKPAVTKTVEAKPAVAASAVKKVTIKKPVAKVAPQKVAKVVKPIKEKTPKLKMERDSFTMPKAEYAQFYVLKDRMVKLGSPVKKSELLRAGIMQLSAMTDAALKLAIAKVPVIKTGRPKKK